MATFSLCLLLSLAIRGLAVPAYGASDELQIPLALPNERLNDLAGHAFEHVQHAIEDTEKAISGGIHHLERWFADGREYLSQNGLVCAYHELSPARV